MVQVAARQMVEWSRQILMNINTRKTKEMQLGRILFNPPPLYCLVVNSGTTERVTSFKLLGLTIANNLSFDEHKQQYAVVIVYSRHSSMYALCGNLGQ